MKPKQLANVLLKIVGLSLCLHSIPSIFTTITMVSTPLGYATGAPTLHDPIFRQAIISILSFAASGVIQIVIGILAIVKSQKISEFLFKNESE